MDLGDDHGGAIHLGIVDREMNRRGERSGLGRQTLLERLHITQSDGPESGPLVETEDDRPTAGLVRQRAERRGQRAGQAACGGLDLDLGAVASGRAQAADHLAQSCGTPKCNCRGYIWSYISPRSWSEGAVRSGIG
jgi:hypothetical protein